MLVSQLHSLRYLRDDLIKLYCLRRFVEKNNNINMSNQNNNNNADDDVT